MRKTKILSSVLLFFYLNAFAQCPVIPSPVSYESEMRVLEFPQSFTVNFGKTPAEIRNYLSSELQSRFSLSSLNGKKKALIQFVKVKNSHPDFYQIDVDKKVIVSYSSDESCFYALNTLLQLIDINEKKDGTKFITCCKLTDYPKFSWRGLHLDVSRHFFTVQEVKRYIDLMAFYKFNTFHWHLTDDQGWRIEIKKYPKLTEIGAWRDSTVNSHYSTVPRTYTKERYGGFYTQEEIREIVSYAGAKYITVVPEIEMPGHSRAALAAYPEFSCTGKQQEVPGLWGIFEDIYCSKPESIQFMKDIVGEVLDLFPSTYIHIGGDEAPKDRWKMCPKCQQVIKENGLKDEHGLQSYFIRQMDDFLTSRGRKLIGWDEILEGGLSPNATVMSWRGFEGGIAAVKQGHQVVMSPGSHCYFDHYQSDFAGEHLAIGGFTSLEKVYGFNPVPPDLNESEAKLVLGGQANLWTEYIPDMDQLEYMTYPRALALAQVLWCVNKPAYEEFSKTMVRKQLPELKRLHVNYSEALFYPTFNISKTPDGIELKLHKPRKPDDDLTQVFKRKDYLMKKQSWELEWNPGTKADQEVNFKYKLLLHSALGLSIRFLTPPNPRYSNQAEIKLTDGVLGRRPWNGKEWLGFDTNAIEFSLDLGQESTLKNMTLSFLDDPGSWIHLPQKIEVLTSSDQLDWKKSESTKMEELSYVILSKKARYIRVRILTAEKIPEGLPGAGNQPWTFLDEIFIDYQPD